MDNEIKRVIKLENNERDRDPLTINHYISPDVSAEFGATLSRPEHPKWPLYPKKIQRHPNFHFPFRCHPG